MCALRSSLERFQGCVIGALIGDCLGAPFEGQSWSDPIKRSSIICKISPDILCGKEKNSMSYTDDTAMLKSVCSSLLHCKKFDSVDMASRFAEEFMSDKNRGYGGAVVDIFYAWNEKKIEYSNVFEPSNSQFEGYGSYGNGGAMRVAPVALFATSLQECAAIAEESARLTHSHPYGYMGAILQALTVYKCLHTTGKINWQEFLHEIRKEMYLVEKRERSATKSDDCNIEKSKEEDGSVLSEEEKLYIWTRSESFSYMKQLDVIEELLKLHYENKKEDDVSCVINRLGRDVSSQQAVPAALYCFLRNLESGFEETLYYAISLGGDTDTIGSMCCAMAGAYHGYNAIPSSWISVSEMHLGIKQFADKFYEFQLST